jgi:hypothetical protein
MTMHSEDIITEMYRRGTVMGKNLDILLKQEPFRPFEIHMTGGHGLYLIKQPSDLEIRDSVAEVRMDGQRRAMLSLMHIARADVVQAPADEVVIVQVRDRAKE